MCPNDLSTSHVSKDDTVVVGAVPGGGVVDDGLVVDEAEEPGVDFRREAGALVVVGLLGRHVRRGDKFTTEFMSVLEQHHHHRLGVGAARRPAGPRGPLQPDLVAVGGAAGRFVHRAGGVAGHGHVPQLVPEDLREIYQPDLGVLVRGGDAPDGQPGGFAASHDEGALVAHPPGQPRGDQDLRIQRLINL